MAERRIPRAEATASQWQTEATIKHRQLTLTSAEPQFRRSSTVDQPSAWASAVTVNEQTMSSELADVFPPDLRDVTDLLQPAGPSDPVTATTEGLIARFDSFRNRLWWKIPTGTEVFIDWLARRGIEARVSGAGKTTEEFIRTLGGPHVAIHVGTTELVKVIGRAAATPGGVIKFPELRQVLGRQHKNHTTQMDRHVAFLAEKGVVQPVVSAKCHWCSHTNWFSPVELENTLDCQRCARPFPFPPSPPPGERKWGYRPLGPFATPDFAHGAYSVALAIRFFLLFGFMTREHTWTTSLEGHKDGQHFEIDFGIWQSSELDDKPPTLVLGEAKTFREFQSDDFRRAERLLRDFPEATMAFATLQQALTDKERSAIVKLATKGKGTPNYGRIVVLTANELTDHNAMGPDYGWKQQGGRAAEVADRHQHVNTLRELSRATLDLYAEHQRPSPKGLALHPGD
jgi:hypothetical protein